MIKTVKSAQYFCLSRTCCFLTTRFDQDNDQKMAPSWSGKQPEDGIVSIRVTIRRWHRPGEDDCQKMWPDNVKASRSTKPPVSSTPPCTHRSDHWAPVGQNKQCLGPRVGVVILKDTSRCWVRRSPLKIPGKLCMSVSFMIAASQHFQDGCACQCHWSY